MTAMATHLPLAAPAPAAYGPPLSTEHVRDLTAARHGAKRIRRTVRVATFDGWTVGVFGALTLLCGMFTAPGWVLGGGMLVIACVELRAVEGLKLLDPAAARRLGWNQIALGALLLGYALWSLYGAWFGPGALASTIAQAPEAAGMLAPYEGMLRLINIAIYVGLALIAIFAQGGAAVYYFTREKHVRAYRDQTPGWIIDFQSTGGQL